MGSTHPKGPKHRNSGVLRVTSLATAARFSNIVIAPTCSMWKSPEATSKNRAPRRG